MEGEDVIDAEGDTESENDDVDEIFALLDTLDVSEGDPDPPKDDDTLLDTDGDVEKDDSRVVLELAETLGVLVDECDDAFVTLLLPDANLDMDSHEVTDMRDDGDELRSGDFEPESLLLAPMVELPAVVGDEEKSRDMETLDVALIVIVLVAAAVDDKDALSPELLLLCGLKDENIEVDGDPVEEKVRKIDKEVAGEMVPAAEIDNLDVNESIADGE